MRDHYRILPALLIAAAAFLFLAIQAPAADAAGTCASPSNILDCYNKCSDLASCTTCCHSTGPSRLACRLSCKQYFPCPAPTDDEPISEDEAAVCEDIAEEDIAIFLSSLNVDEPAPEEAEQAGR